MAQQALAVVGSRNPTPQGEQNARQFARHLSAAGLTIVSGLALGVDGAAHDGALLAVDEAAPAQRLATVAIIGTGIDRVYPRQHRALAHRIARHGWLHIGAHAGGVSPWAQCQQCNGGNCMEGLLEWINKISHCTILDSQNI